MSNQLRLLIFIVVISGALCSVQDYVITSKCAHSKPIHISPEGNVSIKDIPTIQNITIAGIGDFWSTSKVFKISLYVKETKMYLCFDNHWNLVGMKRLQETCYFNESMTHGHLEYRSAVDPNRRIGFTHRGKAIGPKKKVKNECYLFWKHKADEYFKKNTSNKPYHHESSLSLSSPQRVPSGKSVGRNSSSLSLSSSKSSILVENGEERQSIRGKKGTKADRKSSRSGPGAARNRQPNRHSSNLSNNSTSNSRRGYSNLSSTNNNHRNHHNHNNNVQQPSITKLSNLHQDSQSAQHHPVRHHHDNSNSTARRQQNHRERLRIRNNQQQNQHQSTKYVQRATSEMPATASVASATLPILTSIPSLLLPLTSSTPTESSTGDDIAWETTGGIKGRKRKNAFKNRQQQSVNIKDFKNKRTLKRQQKSIGSSSSPSTTEYVENDSLSSTLASPLFSLTTEDAATLSSLSFNKMLMRSTIEPYNTITSEVASSSEPTPMALLQELHSSSTVLIDPSPSAHFEQIALSTIIPCSTTALDDSSSSPEPSLDESSFNVLYPASQLTDDLSMTPEFNFSGQDEVNYAPTTDNTEYVKNYLSTENINSPNFASNYSKEPIRDAVLHSNHNTKYSNDSASLTSVLPNYLDNSMTEYQNSNSTSNLTNNENKSNYTKYYKTGNMGSDKLLVAISNTVENSATSTNTASTPTTTNRNSKNISSYLNSNNRNKSRKFNSNINAEKLFSTEKTISNKFNRYDNITNNIQHSSYYSTSSTKTNKIVTNLLDSEEKMYYNRKCLNSTASTADLLQVLTTASTKTAVTTKITNNHNVKSININNYVDDDTVEGGYDTVGDDDFISEEITGSNEELRTIGYLPTTTSQLPEIIKIGVNKIKGNRSRFRKYRNIGF